MIRCTGLPPVLLPQRMSGSRCAGRMSDVQEQGHPQAPVRSEHDTCNPGQRATLFGSGRRHGKNNFRGRVRLPPETGRRFFVLAPTACTVSPPHCGVPRMSESLRVLIADDESLHNLALASQLETLGHQVVATAANGREAVELARDTKPDLAFLDIRMPTMTGPEAAHEIASDRPIPMIILSAYSDARTVDEA